MRPLVLCLLIALASIGAQAQTRLTGSRQEQVIAKVEQAVQAQKSMQCQFTQVKSMKLLKRDMESSGVMYFNRPDQLRWQYSKPYDYTFVLNGEKVGIQTAKSAMNVQNEKMFSQIAHVILNCITGGNLRSTSDFELELFEQQGTCFARLHPKKKELKQIYSLIEIHFNATLTMVDHVRMEEKTGDVTLITLHDVKSNVPIDPKLFAVP